MESYKLGIVIPWRPTPSRIKPFNIVVDWYKTNFPDATIYLANREGKKWHPSGSRNDGVAIAEKDGCNIIVCNDADTLPQLKPLLDTIQAALEDNYIHNPYTRCNYYDEEITNKFINDEVDLDNTKHTSYNEASFGVNVFTPKAWWSIGGMDEKFYQWGPEDEAMQVAHRVIHGRPFVKHEGTIYCLGHEKQIHDDGFVEQHYKNTALYLEYLNIKDPELMLDLVKRKEFLKRNHDENVHRLWVRDNLS